MHLTLHTDYGLRVLLYLAHFPDQRPNTREISEAYGISKNHLVRVVQALADEGFVHTTIGRGGGITLAKSPEKIRIGDVVRACEPSFHLVECFNLDENTCPIVPVCGLKPVLAEAMKAFLTSLDQYTLADILSPRQKNRFVQLLLTNG